MEKYDEYQLKPHEDLSEAVRTSHDTDLSGLIDISATTDQPIVITDDGRDVGVVNKSTLLKGIKGGKD
jgi:glycine betaine/proline transport system ATP-binding protein